MLTNPTLPNIPHLNTFFFLCSTEEQRLFGNGTFFGIFANHQITVRFMRKIHLNIRWTRRHHHLNMQWVRVNLFSWLAKEKKLSIFFFGRNAWDLIICKANEWERNYVYPHVQICVGFASNHPKFDLIMLVIYAFFSSSDKLSIMLFITKPNSIVSPRNTKWTSHVTPVTTP